MSATSENVATIEAALLEGASIRRVIDLQVATAGPTWWSARRWTSTRSSP
ncbi:hypothetical protein [Leucobacter soli]